MKRVLIIVICSVVFSCEKGSEMTYCSCDAKKKMSEWLKNGDVSIGVSSYDKLPLAANLFCSDVNKINGEYFDLQGNKLQLDSCATMYNKIH